jgi:hypothetical protein
MVFLGRSPNIRAEAWCEKGHRSPRLVVYVLSIDDVCRGHFGLGI